MLVLPPITPKATGTARPGGDERPADEAFAAVLGAALDDPPDGDDGGRALGAVQLRGLGQRLPIVTDEPVLAGADEGGVPEEASSDESADGAAVGAISSRVSRVLGAAGVPGADGEARAVGEAEGVRGTSSRLAEEAEGVRGISSRLAEEAEGVRGISSRLAAEGEDVEETSHRPRAATEVEGAARVPEGARGAAGPPVDADTDGDEAGKLAERQATDPPARAQPQGSAASAGSSAGSWVASGGADAGNGSAGTVASGAAPVTDDAAAAGDADADPDGIGGTLPSRARVVSAAPDAGSRGGDGGASAAASTTATGGTAEEPGARSALRLEPAVAEPARSEAPVRAERSTLVARIAEIAEQLERAAPPRQMTVEVGELRLSVSLRGDNGVRVAVIGDAGAQQLEADWRRELADALSERGLDLEHSDQGGRGDERPGDRSLPRDQRPGTQRRAATDGALRL